MSGGGGGTARALAQAVEDYGYELDREAVSYVLEDTRLSTLQRKLIREENKGVALAISLHINECLLYPENATYIGRSSDVIQEAIVEVIRSKEHTKIVKEQCGRALGRVGTLHSDFEQWTSGIWRLFEGDGEAGKIIYMLGIEECLSRGGGTPDGVAKVLDRAKAKLEDTQSEILMMSLLGIMEAAAEKWPICFSDIFQEIVDICVGWFMEYPSMPDIRRRIFKALSSWRPQWRKEGEFATDQLGFYMEDLMLEVRPGDDEDDLEEDTAETSELIKVLKFKFQSDEEPEEKQNAQKQMMSFLQMIETVLRGVRPDSGVAVVYLPKIGIWLEMMERVAMNALEWRWSEDLALTSLHCILVAWEQCEAQQVERLDARQAQVVNFFSHIGSSNRTMSTMGHLSLLNSLASMITVFKCNTQTPALTPNNLQIVVQTLLGVAGLLSLSTCHQGLQKAGINVCHLLLQSKNVMILQEVYGLLLSRLEQAMVVLADQPTFLPTNPWREEKLSKLQARRQMFFVMASISNIATTKSSVMSMFALDPRVFDLLVDVCGIRSAKFAVAHSSLHQAVVALLLKHSSTHSYFLSTSVLLAVGSTSPTANHFSTLVTVMAFLQSWSCVSTPTRSLIIAEISIVLTACKASAAVLINKPEFHQLVASGIKICYNFPDSCLAEMGNLAILLSDYPLEMNDMTDLADLFLHLVQSGNRKIIEQAQNLLAKLPPLLIYSRERAKFNQDTAFKGPYSAVIQALRSIFKTEVNPDTIRGSDFRDLMFYMSGEKRDATIVPGWRSNILELAGETGEGLIASSQGLQLTWLAWVAAQFCVIGKLKTPIGKAQDTLGHIDSSIRKLSSQHTEKIDMQQAHTLLVFLQCLEKSMVNGWDGSVSALPPANKSTALFFHANRATCTDWLARVRGTSMKVAYSAGLYSEVVRQAWWVLPALAKRGELEQPAQLGLVVLACLALAKLDAPHNLAGLYAWARDKAATKLRWIPGLIDLVRRQTESGVKSLKSVIDGAEDSLKPRLEELIWEGHCSMVDHNNYVEWMEKYKKSSENDKVDKNQKAVQEGYLTVLSKFQDGVIPLAVEGLDPSCLIHQGPLVQHLTDVVHLHLLQAAASLQNSYMRNNSNNWTENDKMAASLTKANAGIARLLSSTATTDNEKQKILMLNMVANEITNVKERTHSGPTSLGLLLRHEKSGCNSELLLIIKKWGEFFSRFRQRSNYSQDWNYQISALNLEIARVARKEGNLQLSEKFLLRSLTGRTNVNMSLEEYVRKLDFFNSAVTVEKAVGLRQSSKLFLRREAGGGELAVRTVAGLVLALGQHQHNRHYQDKSDHLLEESSRALLTLTRWLKDDTKLFESVYPEMVSNTSDLATLTQVLHLETVTPGNRDSIQKHIPVGSAASDNDLVLGRLLRLAVIQDPTLKKAWNELADWAYQMGQRGLEVSVNNRVELTEDEIRTVKAVLPGMNDKDREVVLGVISQVSLKDSHLAGYEYEKWDFMRKELRDTGVLDSVQEGVVQQLVAVWQAVFRRTYAYYDLSVEAYFKYLRLAGSHPAPGTIPATLRLLHLTVNHALELQEVFQLGLANTPAAQWKAIIPQLFSRLNHPVPIVKQRISDLLCRISETYPHMIVFPAIVGSLAAGNTASQAVTNIFTGSLLEGATPTDKADDMEEKEAGTQEMASAHAKIVDVLSKKSPKAIEQVSVLVGELRRITLLWDELWLGTLLQYSTEVQRRVKRCQEEAARLEANKSLSEAEKKDLLVDKYNIIFTPVLYVLDQVAAITRAAPETPHEEAFQKKYGKFINSLLEKVRCPSNWSAPGEVWSGLSQLQQQLQVRAGKRNHALKLAEISPALYTLKDTYITMPGEQAVSDGVVSIAKFEGTLSILPTKTKPKKMSMVGDNGLKYTYLFKGLEDLHLDERIMQFLWIANQMMCGHKQQAMGAVGSGQVGRYRARHYSVVPLGPRSGLIQWVEGAIPMFSLFKKWQLRQQQHLENAKKPEEAAKVVGKPSDMFYSKMLPLLRKHGISKMDDRKSWPITLLKQVLAELIAETPDNLLSQELWLVASNSQQWWKLVQNITRSFAVMSVIGYIIGLGDRHLDNVLVDLNQGQVVHIDYNISFEKGRNLRIPERVPCRLTQNIVSVFGVSGVEGLFRQSCEHTLRVMRSGRETLLTLLEAFVYDPLVDWTPGLEGGLAGAMYGGQGAGEGQEKREMEHSLTFSMLGVRVAEMRGGWLENQHDLLAALMQVEESVGVWLELAGGVSKRGEELTAMHKAMSILKEAEVNPGHKLHGLMEQYMRHKAVEGGAAASRQRVAAFAAECDKMMALHNRAIISISGPQLGKWTQEVRALVEQAGVSSSGTVREFLENAGQRELLGQYHAMEGELVGGVKRLEEEIKKVLDHLHMYHALTSLYPASSRSTHRVSMYSQWGNRLQDNFSVETCDQIANEFTSVLSIQPSNVKALRAQHVKNMNMQLEQWNSEIIIGMQRLYQRMMGENIMKPGKAGILEELGKTREMILTQLNHPDSGVRPDTLVCFFINNLISLAGRCLELEKSLADESLSENNSVTVNQRADSTVDQLLHQYGVLNTMLTTIDMLNLASKSPHVHVLEALSSVMLSLQQLRASFCTIIMPEGLKNFLHEDVTVLETANVVEEIIMSGGLALNELRHELQLHTRCVMLGMDSSHQPAVEVAAAMKHRYQQLIAAAGFSEAMTTGQMLLCAANSLFDKVDAEMANLRLKVAEAVVTNDCSKLTLVKAAADISTGAFSSTPGVWDCLSTASFLARLELLRDFFSMCKGAARAFKAENIGQMMPTGDMLIRPVKRFVAEYMQTLLLGAGPRHTACAIVQFARESEDAAIVRFMGVNATKEKVEIEDMSQALFDDKMATGALNQARLAKSSILVKNLSGIVVKWELAQQLDLGVEILAACQQINALQHAGIQWYHEEYLPRDRETKLVEPVRHTFLSELRSGATIVTAIHAELNDLLGRYSDLRASVDQRLRWAVGANPGLQEIADQFSGEHAGQLDCVRHLGTVAKSLSGLVASCLQHEALRTSTNEARASDHQFLAILAQGRESAQAQMESSENFGLSTEELALLDVNPPQDNIDAFWIKQTEELIAARVKSIQDVVNLENGKFKDVQRGIQDIGMGIKDIVNTHHKLMADVALLLRTITRIENFEFPALLTFMSRYKGYSELLNHTIKEILNEDLDEDSARGVIDQLEALRDDTTYVYEELINIAAVARDEGLVQEMFKSRRSLGKEDGDAKREQSVEMDEKNKAKREKLANGGKGQVMEEKNKFALSVLRRVRIKLEGREPDALRKASIGEQVDFLVRESMNQENMALMYEGWTAWI